MEKEIRKINSDFTTSSDRTVMGYGAVFNSYSVDMGFIEIIHPSAITDETIKRSDIFCKLNHNDDKILARSKYGEGSLLLSVDERGLSYCFESPKTALGDELLEYLKRGDISGSSFAFTVSKEEGAEKWSKRSDGKIYREIFAIDRLYDVSPVFQCAYEATTCSTRFAEIQATIAEVEGIMNVYKEEIDKL